MKKHLIKRTLSLLMAVTMLLGLLTLNASAETEYIGGLELIEDDPNRSIITGGWYRPSYLALNDRFTDSNTVDPWRVVTAKGVQLVNQPTALKFDNVTLNFTWGYDGDGPSLGCEIKYTAGMDPADWTTASYIDPATPNVVYVLREGESVFGVPSRRKADREGTTSKPGYFEQCVYYGDYFDWGDMIEFRVRSCVISEWDARYPDQPIDRARLQDWNTANEWDIIITSHTIRANELTIGTLDFYNQDYNKRIGDNGTSAVVSENNSDIDAVIAKRASLIAAWNAKYPDYQFTGSYIPDTKGAADFDTARSKKSLEQGVPAAHVNYGPPTWVYGETKPDVTPEAYVEPFTDVLTSAKYADAVKWAYANGVTSGVSAAQFAPNGTCDRAQVVTFLYNLAGKPDVSLAAGTGFDDVSPNAWYAKAVVWAKANKVTSGVSATEFDPNGTCTYEQVVALVYNYGRTLTPLGGQPGANWYDQAIDWALDNGVATQGDILIGQPCPRWAIVQFMYNMNDTVNK